MDAIHPMPLFTLGTIFGFSIAYCVLRLFQPSKPLSHSEQVVSFADFPNAHAYRMIIGVRNDLKMSKGKVAAQVAHAAVAGYEKASRYAPKMLQKWIRHGQAKITVRLESEEEMIALAAQAKGLGILVSIIRDAGRTQVDPGTQTVIAFGPAPKDHLDKVTAHLKLY